MLVRRDLNEGQLLRLIELLSAEGSINRSPRAAARKTNAASRRRDFMNKRQHVNTRPSSAKLKGRSRPQNTRQAVSRRSLLTLIGAACIGVGSVVRAADRGSIKVGTSAGLSGPIAETMKAYTAGLQLGIERANLQRGIDGRSIALKVLDDKYQGAVAVSNTQSFLVEGANVLLGYAGTGPTQAVMQFLEKREQNDAVLFGPFTGASHLREKKSARTIFLIGDYVSEIDRLITHFVTVGATRISAVYQNDEFGKPLADYTAAALVSKRLSPPPTVPVEPGAALTAKQLDQVLATSPHAVLMFTVAGPTISSIKALRGRFTGPIGLLSFLSNRAFISALGADAAGVVISQVVPGPYDTNHPLIRDLLSAEVPHRSELTHAYITGYFTSRLFVETLKISRGNTSPSQLQAAWNALKVKRPFGFAFSDHGAQYVDITMLKADGKFIR